MLCCATVLNEFYRAALSGWAGTHNHRLAHRSWGLRCRASAIERDWRRTAGVALVIRTISERGGV